MYKNFKEYLKNNNFNTIRKNGRYKTSIFKSKINISTLMSYQIFGDYVLYTGQITIHNLCDKRRRSIRNYKLFSHTREWYTLNQVIDYQHVTRTRRYSRLKNYV